jgi:preprotein translocase subunit SecD
LRFGINLLKACEMKKAILIILLCCAGLMLTFLALTAFFMYLQHQQSLPLSKPPEHGTEFLIQADLSQTPGDTNALASLGETLIKRFSGMGKRVFIESLPPSQLRVELPITNHNEADSISEVIVRPGFLELRTVNDDSDEMLQNHKPVPSDYELLTHTVIETDGQTNLEQMLVKKEPERGLSGNIVKHALVASDNLGEPEIELEFNQDSAIAFAQFTKENVGHRLAIVVDHELYSAPKIMDPIETGDCQIVGNLDETQAMNLVNVLNHPLPVPIKIVETKTF